MHAGSPAYDRSRGTRSVANTARLFGHRCHLRRSLPTDPILTHQVSPAFFSIRNTRGCGRLWDQIGWGVKLKIVELGYENTPLGELTLRRREEPRLEDRVVFEVKLGDEYLMSSLYRGRAATRDPWPGRTRWRIGRGRRRPWTRLHRRGGTREQKCEEPPRRRAFSGSDRLARRRVASD